MDCLRRPMVFFLGSMPRLISQTSATEEVFGLGRRTPRMQLSAATSSFSLNWPARTSSAVSTRYLTPTIMPSGTCSNRMFRRPSSTTPDEITSEVGTPVSEIQRRIAKCPLTLSVVEEAATYLTLPSRRQNRWSVVPTPESRSPVGQLRFGSTLFTERSDRKPRCEFCEVSFEAITSFFVFHVKVALEGKRRGVRVCGQCPHGG